MSFIKLYRYIAAQRDVLIDIAAHKKGNSLTRQELEKHLIHLDLGETETSERTLVGAHDFKYHNNRTVIYAALTGRKMGLRGEKLHVLGFSASHHDIGKTEIPDYILNKPGKPDDDEWEKIRMHPIFSEMIINPYKYLPEYTGKIVYPLEDMGTFARHHHERWDGKGYPDRKKEDDIPLESRIIAVSDSYDAMTSERVYNKKKTQEEAIKELEACAGTQFDPKVVDCFILVLKKYFKNTLYIDEIMV